MDILLAQRLTAARQGYSFSRVWMSLTTLTWEREESVNGAAFSQHVAERHAAFSQHFTKRSQLWTLPSPGCPQKGPARTQPHVGRPCAPGRTPRCPGTPACGEEGRGDAEIRRGVSGGMPLLILRCIIHRCI